MKPSLILFLVCVAIVFGISPTASANSVILNGELPGSIAGSPLPTDFWYFSLGEESDLTIDLLAHELSCSFYPTDCTDFFGNGVGNDLMDSVLWVGDAAFPPPTTGSMGTPGLIDVSDDGGVLGYGDGSVSNLDSFLDLHLLPGKYVLSIENILYTGGRYQLTLTATDTDTLSAYPIPEPSAALLFGVGGFTVAWALRGRKGTGRTSCVFGTSGT